MAKYEMLYILDSATSDETKEALVAKFESIVKDNAGSIEKTDKMGMKKLAYPIARKSEGYYVVMTFEAAPSLIAEIERVARITDGVIRTMITKL